MGNQKERPGGRTGILAGRFGPLWDLGLFVAIAAWALIQDLQTTDLVWSLWLASLTVGYAFILVAVVRSAFFSHVPPDDEHPEFAIEPDAPLPIRMRKALFMVLFFTAHFGLAHFIHGAFLCGLFPLAAPVGIGLWSTFSLDRVLEYWPFALSSLVAWRRAFIEETHQVKPGRPYRQVARMHLAILLLFLPSLFGVANRALYLVVLFVYFFPWPQVSWPGSGGAAGGNP